jgi:hypothetical protein
VKLTITEQKKHEAVLKNWLDGLEPLPKKDALDWIESLDAEQKKTAADALKPESSFSTVEDEHLQNIPEVNPAFDVDRAEWVLAEELNLGLEEATRVLEWHKREIDRELHWELSRMLSFIISELVKPCKNLPARVYGLVFATGLDQANAIHSQAEIGRKLNCSRALISHYTIDWVNKMNIFNYKFRKSENSRKTFKDCAIRTTVDRKLWAWAKGNSI